MSSERTYSSAYLDAARDKGSSTLVQVYSTLYGKEKLISHPMGPRGARSFIHMMRMSRGHSIAPATNYITKVYNPVGTV